MAVGAVFAILAALLFLGSFFTKRRFGLLGLALTAGATLSTIWDYEAGLIVAGLGIVPEGPLTNAVTLSIIVLLPATLLLFHGYSYKRLPGRIVGSLLFAVLALAFLVEPIGYALPLEGVGADIYRWLMQYRELIISVGVVAAVIDLFFTKPAALVESNKKKR